MKNQTGSTAGNQSNGQKPPAKNERSGGQAKDPSGPDSDEAAEFNGLVKEQPSGDHRSGGQANDPSDLDVDEAAEFDGLVKKHH